MVAEQDEPGQGECREGAASSAKRRFRDWIAAPSSLTGRFCQLAALDSQRAGAARNFIEVDFGGGASDSPVDHELVAHRYELEAL